MDIIDNVAPAQCHLQFLKELPQARAVISVSADAYADKYVSTEREVPEVFFV